MKFKTEHYVTDILIEFNDYDNWEVCYGNYQEDDWSPILAEFYFKSDALEYSLSIFKKMDFRDKMLVILDPTKELELDFLSSDEEIEKLIGWEIANGN
jgi:hypothetical protein